MALVGAVSPLFSQEIHLLPLVKHPDIHCPARQFCAYFPGLHRPGTRG